MPDFIDPGTARRILARLAEQDSSTALRDAAIVECLACAGFRWTELSDLEVTVGPAGPLLVLRSAKGSVSSARVVATHELSAVTALVAARSKDHPSGPLTLFASSGPLRLPSRSTFLRRLAVVADAVGVEAVPTTGSLRRGWISDMFSQGASLDEVARYLRHRRPDEL